MGAGWGRPNVGDDVDEIMAKLQGTGDDQYPRGFAGLAPASLAAAATGQYECKLNAWMRVQKLCLNTAALVDTVRVTRIDIGTIALNVGQSPVPAVCFARDAVGTQLDAAVWASPQVYPVVTMSNGTTAAIVIEGGFFGPVSRTAPAGDVAA
jgi:hypothetical protein